MKAKVSIHRNSKPLKPSMSPSPRKPGEAPPVWPRKRTPEEKAKTLAWHAAEMRKAVEICAFAVLKAQRKLDKLTGGVGVLDALSIHLDQFEHIAKDEAAKCK